MSFYGDETRRPEVRSYIERMRSDKEPEGGVSERRFIIEQEAARLHCYGLIGEMNALGIWGK